MRYFLQLTFDGTNFHGWQRQKHHPSIQQAVEEGLRLILRRKIQCHGCGRTDAGVHASMYFAHISLKPREELDLTYRLNKVLSNDILALQLIDVPANAHAQRDATQRSYNYYVHLVKNPFIHKYSAWYPSPEINFKYMQDAAQVLTNYTDFSIYCKTPDRHKSTVCRIDYAKWEELQPGHFRFEIKANHFLRNMIRLLVGNMIEIGTGRLSIDEFIATLDQQTKPKFFRLAPPQGLHLTEVIYPYPVSVSPKAVRGGNIFYGLQ